MNERSVHGGPSPHGAPAAAPVRHAPNAYDQPLAQVSRPSRPMAREPLPATGRDPEVTAERSDGYWFRQWVDAPRGGSEDDMAGTGSLSGLVNLEGGEVEAFVDQLSPRLQATLDQQLDLLLHLPHLGRIRVTAQRLGGTSGWDIGLSGESEETRARLSSRTGRLEEALAQSLGQPVVVRVTHEEEASVT
ncbi:type III secretion system HrpP C-terminal domain-containing protein [Pseudomonas alvandae]|uniref:type III secretion system HrpP C-terminal domain-containing protein n=1 Tax=Pseudomonas canavaninivorans TaxID=2842348 RepID=UPI00215E67FA|nr:type III secretion system HrpP C-terminal domain-containing protein [Pseudomonas canavaninivorans]UVM72297.1 type III secretion system HrpP C-terminal domain-containing protein [Pseudomonas canavaninivorans]